LEASYEQNAHAHLVLSL